MGPDVRGEVRCLREPLVAGITFVGFFPRVGPHVCLQGAGSRVRLTTQVTQVHLQISCCALEGRPGGDWHVREGVILKAG